MSIPTYAAIADTDIDVGSPTKSPTGYSFRDNLLSVIQWDTTRIGQPVVCQGAFDPDAIQNADIGTAQVDARCISGAFGQSQVKSSTGTFSVTLGYTAATAGQAGTTLPGGDYGFWPTVDWTAVTGSDPLWVSVGLYRENTLSSSLAAAFGSTWMGGAGTGSQTLSGSQLYIIASPPYDLGDGEIPLFVYAEIDTDGTVLSTWIAQDPPWHVLTKPPVPVTTVTPGKKMDVKGKIIQQKDTRSTAWMHKTEIRYPADAVTPQARLAFRKSTNGVYEPVTAASKNRTMPLLPHPFIKPRGTVVLVDPMSTADLADVHAHESITKLLHTGDIILTQESATRKLPPGVAQASWKWR